MGTPLESLTKLPRPFGPFTLIRLIAQGGMGQVFLALRPVEGEPTDEVCVVKTVRTDLREDREAVGRFLDEARIIQLLDHGNICHTLDAGVHERTYYLALEFISGRNFRDIQQRSLKLGMPLPDDVIFHGIVQMLDALAYAHSFRDAKTGASLGVVHRDVSPHNLMLGFDGYVKLIDFGLAAHTLKREMTRPGIMVGKLRYNAPEQVRDRALDGRSDLYSAGVMLYELLVGERFYEGLSEEDIWRVAMKGNFRPRGFSALPRTARSVLELALAPEPEERYPSAQHMRDAVLELGRSRGISEGRRASARFMSELFVDERQAERDMILQATGLAEARTRLFEVPALSDEPSGSSSRSSLGRSHAVSPARVRGRLADLLSEEFDPDAQTMLPQAPEISSEGRSGSSASGAFALEGDHTDVAKGGQRRTSGRMGEADTVVRSAPGSVERGSERAAAAPTRPIVDENLHLARAATVPAAPLSSPVPRVTAEVRRREPPTAANANSSRRVLAGLAALAVLLLGAVAVAAWIFAPGDGEREVVVVEAPTDPPSDPSTDPPSDPPSDPAADPPSDPSVDPPSDPIAAVDAGADTAAEVDSGEPVPALDDDHGRAAASDAERAKAAALRADKAKAKAAERDRLTREKNERERLAREKIERDRMAREQAERDRTRPPARELKTLKEQVGYLKEFCLQRVACASPAVEESKRFAALSPDQTKALLSEINRCIQKCQR